MLFCSFVLLVEHSLAYEYIKTFGYYLVLKSEKMKEQQSTNSVKDHKA